MSRRLSPGDRVGHVPPTLAWWSLGRRPVRLGGALQRGTRAGIRSDHATQVNPASPAPPGCPPRRTRSSSVSRDRPCGAPLVRFYSLQRSPATPRLELPSGGATRRTMPLRRSSAGPVGVRECAPRCRSRSVRPCGFTLVSRDGTRDMLGCSGPRKPRPPSARVMRRLESSEAAFRYPLPKLRGPAETLCSRLGGAHGVRPFAVLLLPARLRGRCPSRRNPPAVSRSRRPDDFRRGIGRATLHRSGSWHPLCSGDVRSMARSPQLLGLVCPSRAIRAVDRACPLARALNFAGGRDCLGLCLSQVFGTPLGRCSDGLDPIPGRLPPERVLHGDESP